MAIVRKTGHLKSSSRQLTAARGDSIVRILLKQPCQIEFYRFPRLSPLGQYRPNWRWICVAACPSAPEIGWRSYNYAERSNSHLRQS